MVSNEAMKTKFLKSIFVNMLMKLYAQIKCIYHSYEDIYCNHVQSYSTKHMVGLYFSIPPTP